MKKIIIISLLLTFSIPLFAGGAPSAEKNINTRLAVESLLMGLESDNQGLKISSAYELGELKANKSVIPLMKMLHSGKDDESRIMAALSLTKIGTGIGLYAVKRASRFDESKRVRNQCARFYAQHINDQKTK